MKLREFQKQFRESLLNDNNDLDVIVTDDRISTADRMQVYRNNVMVSLTKAVTAVYPMIEKLVGKEFMKQTVKDYVRSNLPTHGNLNAYGESFPDFIRRYKPAKDLPYLYDMARLEWAWEYAEHAKDDTPLQPGELQAIPEDRLPDLNFILRDNIGLIQSDYPLDKIIDFCRTEKHNRTLDIESGGVCLMVCRPFLKVQLQKISEDEFLFLQELQQGSSLLDAAEKAADMNHDFDLTSILQKHLETGLYRDFQKI